MRLAFSVFSFTLGVPVVWAMAQREVRGREIQLGPILRSNDIILRQARNAEVVYQIGQWVIDPYDELYLPNLLHEELGLDVNYDNLATTRLRFYEIALHTLAVRFRHMGEIFFEALRKNPESAEDARNAMLTGWTMMVLNQSSERYSLTKRPPGEVAGHILSDAAELVNLIADRYASVCRVMKTLFGT